jgi:hypothetical protein
VAIGFFVAGAIGGEPQITRMSGRATVESMERTSARSVMNPCFICGLNFFILHPCSLPTTHLPLLTAQAVILAVAVIPGVDPIAAMRPAFAKIGRWGASPVHDASLWCTWVYVALRGSQHATLRTMGLGHISRSGRRPPAISSVSTLENIRWQLACQSRGIG